MIGSHLISLAAFLALAVSFKESIPPVRDWLFGGAAGLAGGIGLMLLYRSLAEGRMSVAAPVSAVVAAVLAVVAIAWLSALESPADTAQSQWHMEENSVEGMHAAHTLRGQAWATELFGRRYGRNLLA